MQEVDPCKRLTVLKPESTRSLGKPKLKWLESVEEDLKKIFLGELQSYVTGLRRVEDNFGRS